MPAIELPNNVYARLAAEASARGVTAAEWIAMRLAAACEGKPRSDHTTPSLTELMAPHIGTIASGGLEAIAARLGDPFSDHLVEKKRAGRL